MSRPVVQSSSDDSDSERQSALNAKVNAELLKKAVTSNNKAYFSDGGDVVVCSESGSEKESGASRDSDSSTSVSCYHLPLKRKTPEKSNSKPVEGESSSKVLVRDCESFLQADSCSKLAKTAKFYKCRECYKSLETNQYSCRFFSFRKVKWSKNVNVGLMYSDGFASPDDAVETDKELWLPNLTPYGNEHQPSNKDHLDFHVARFILAQVGDQFCSLLRQEEDAINLHMGDEDSIAWKKPMQGVREMCDVCKTTLFNFHWACTRCGFVVCIDCYKSRRNGQKKTWMEKGQDHDEWKWLHCTTRVPHQQDELMLCQTIAGDCLSELGHLVHYVRDLYEIPQTCKCDRTCKTKLKFSIDMVRVKELMKSNDPLNAIISHLEGGPKRVNSSEEHEAHIVLEADKQKLPDDEIVMPVSANYEDSSSDSDDEMPTSGLFGLLTDNCNGNGPNVTRNSPVYQPVTRTCDRITRNGSAAGPPNPPKIPSQPKVSPVKRNKISSQAILDDVISTIQEDSKPCQEVKMQHFVRRNRGSTYVSRNELPPRVMTRSQSVELYPGVPHSWLCDGWLLRLINPSHSGNYRIFQDQWRRGQPVIVGNMTSLLNMKIWHPDSFCKDFGDERNDLINCATGNLVPNRPMREFWEGFENFSKRLKDEHGNPMLLKLKDWPPGEDFAELLPQRFEDLMQALPLAEYTRRTGRLNLASCLPDFFVRPDLGPKMYNAYGSALFPTKGTTNLHLDISDAVNFMVYVGIPTDADYEQHIQEAFNAIDEAGCDEMTRRRVRTKEEMPGALWHIYHACDADKIRDLLNKVAIDSGKRLEPHHDPIHDQSWYLDSELRDRLYKDYGVTGYAIVQCLGDAVFIPAGAPHQVRNLHNCVKVAEDFVSPENVSHCFHLTQEFRELSDTHTNHEDKLQIKNIIYHTIKKAVSSLLREVIKPEPREVIKPDNFEGHED